MSKATRMKVPHYFVYAKNKTEEQVEPRNGSPVNRLLDIVPKFKFNFNQRKGGRFDYHILMNNPDLERTAEVDEIIAQYKELSGKMAVRTVGNVDEDGVDRYTYQYQELRRKMFEGRDNPQYVVDAIILGIFGLTSAVRKAAFWGAFGDMVLANLQKNLSERDDILCQKCYNRFTPIDDAATCPYCSTRHHNVKSMYCVDCGEEFFVDIRNNSKVRCNRCQCDLKKEKTRLRVRKFRQM